MNLFVVVVVLIQNIKNKRETNTLSSEMKVRPLVESDEELEQQFSEDENITVSNRLIFI
jgi:hypothetical protein